MVLSSGFYRSQSQPFHLIQDPNDGKLVKLVPSTEVNEIKFRRDKDMWLSIDDGQVGRYGTPDHLRAQIGDTVYRIWVEQRGREQFGLIPTDETGTYSNKFIGIKDGKLTIEDEWELERGAVWVVSTTWDGQPGV